MEVDQKKVDLVRAERARGRELQRRQAEMYVFHIERFLDQLDPAAIDDGTKQRLVSCHFGNPGLYSIREWIRSAEVGDLLMLAGILGMDNVEITPTFQPV